MEKAIDISKHQATYNAATAKTAGISTVFVRLAYAANQDTKVAVFAPAALKAGQKLGAYGFATWHYRDRNGGSLETARALMKQQVSAWVNIAKKVGVNSWIGVDEELESGHAMGLSKGDNTTLLNEAIALLEAAGLSPCVYCSIAWQMQWIGKVNAPFWFAYYYSSAHPDFEAANGGVFPATRYGNAMKAQDVIAWQFDSTGRGAKYGVGSANLDKNWLYRQPGAKDAQGGADARSEYFQKYTGTSGSIAPALQQLGENSTYTYRKTIATKNGITPYSGTVAQNTKMLTLLKAGTLKRP